VKPYHQPISIDETTLATRLRARWMDLCRGIGGDADVASRWFGRLERAYREPSRHHHTLEHIEAMLNDIDRWGTGVRDSAALRLAAWFHDAVYDPRRSDNERKSADLAAKALSEFTLPLARNEQVRSMVLCTRDHCCDVPDGRILVDADLAILASPPERYHAYATAVRQEYAFVSEDDYRAGRLGVLMGFLRRPHIFLTAHGRLELEEAARANLARECAELLSTRPARPIMRRQSGADEPVSPSREVRHDSHS
jgi:predicted metal-dependent HD superfamily phosphohydrolase